MKKLIFVILATITFIPLLSWGIKKKKQATYNSPIVSVAIHRTACFGRCPEYKIEINKNGNVVYTGIRNVKDSGTYKKNIGTAKTLGIMKQLVAYKIDTCSNMYDNRIPDLPGIIYHVTYKDSVKKIYSAEWGPKYLKEMAEQIDKIGKPTDKTWKKMRR